MRQRGLAARRALSLRERQAGERALFHLATQDPALRRASCVAAYHAMGHEIGLAALLAWWLARGTRVLLPRVVGPGEMSFIEVFSPLEAALRPGPWGLREPWGEPTPLACADVVLVPGVAMDAHGGRLGMGKGFYDRALALQHSQTARTLTLGVCHEVQLVERVPMEPHDQRLDGVLTPHRRIWCG